MKSTKMFVLLTLGIGIGITGCENRNRPISVAEGRTLAKEAALMMKDGKHEESVEIYSNVISRVEAAGARVAWRLYASRGLAYYKMAQYSRAIEDTRKAVRLAVLQEAKPESLVTVHIQMGMIMQEQGDVQQAITWYTDAIAIAEANNSSKVVTVDAYTRRSNALKLIGDDRGSEKDRKYADELLKQDG